MYLFYFPCSMVSLHYLYRLTFIPALLVLLPPFDLQTAPSSPFLDV
jgi:hypothetical protein